MTGFCYLKEALSAMEEKRTSAVLKCPLSRVTWNRYSLNLFSPFPKQALVFMCLKYKSWKTVQGKEKLLVMSNFSFSQSVFYLF